MQGYRQAKVAAIPTACDMRGYEQAKIAAIPTACVGRGYEQAKIAAIPTLPTATAVRGTHDRKQRTLEQPVLTPCTVGCYVPLRAKGSGSVPAVVMCASRSVPCANASAVSLTQRPMHQRLGSLYTAFILPQPEQMFNARPSCYFFVKS